MSTRRKKLLGTIIGIPVVIIAGATVFGAYPLDVAHLFTPPTVCEKPLAYSIGDVDSGFGISTTTLKTAATAAEALWEDGTSFDLLEYDPNAPLKINLVFDERQIKTIQEERFKATLDQEHVLYQNLTAQYDALVSAQEKRLDEYNAAGALYEKRLTDYNAKVNHWNSVGGAPEKIYNELSTEKVNLQKLQQELETERGKISKQNATIKTLADKINTHASDFNKSVDTYNDTFTNEQFEQGQYTGNAINVFQFNDTNDLEIVLAHEFGHAFGIDHLSNPFAIMYYLMEKQSTEHPELTTDDINALREVCGLGDEQSKSK